MEYPHSHTTQSMVEERMKGTSRLCRRVSCWWKVSFMSVYSLRLKQHQISHSSADWSYSSLKVLRCKLDGSAAGPFIGPLSRKSLAPSLIHFCFAQTMTFLSVVHTSIWPQWGCTGSKHTWISPNPENGIDGQISPLQIFTPQWKRLVTLPVEVKYPHSGRRGVATSGLSAILPARLQATASIHSGMKRAGGRFKGQQHLLSSLPQCTQTQSHSYLIW